jgi:hypothetical protein
LKLQKINRAMKDIEAKNRMKACIGLKSDCVYNGKPIQPKWRINNENIKGTKLRRAFSSTLLKHFDDCFLSCSR